MLMVLFSVPDGDEVLGNDSHGLVAVSLLPALGAVADDNGHVGGLQAHRAMALPLGVHKTLVLPQELVLDPLQPNTARHERGEVLCLEAVGDCGRFGCRRLQA